MVSLVSESYMQSTVNTVHIMHKYYLQTYAHRLHPNSLRLLLFFDLVRYHLWTNITMIIEI